MKKLLQGRGHVFGEVLAPSAAVDDFTGRAACCIEFEKNRDDLEVEAVFTPTPFIGIQTDQVNSVKSREHLFVLRLQTGSERLAGRSPRGVELGDGHLPEGGGFLSLGGQQSGQVAICRVKADVGKTAFG